MNKNQKENRLPRHTCQKADSVNVKNHKNKKACIYSTIDSPFVLQNPTYILEVCMTLMMLFLPLSPYLPLRHLFH
jgi:hypothetical protein